MGIATGRLARVPPFELGLTLGDFLVPIRVGERVSARVRHVALIVLGAVFIALTANLRIPIPGTPVPITGQTFAVLLVGGALGFRRGVSSVLLYMLMGVVGLPVFAGGESGIDTVAVVRDGALALGATGGYLVGMLLAAPLVGRLAELGWDRHILGAAAAMLLGNVVIYAVGLPWLEAARDFGFTETLARGLYPFVIGDIVKLAIAAALLPVGWWLVGRRPVDR